MPTPYETVRILGESVLNAPVLRDNPFIGLFNQIDERDPRHPGITEDAENSQFDGRTWEFYLGQRQNNDNNILIVLSFNVRELNPHSQSITLNENHFGTTRLFIYDCQSPDGAAITPQGLVDKMIERIPANRRANDIYSIETNAGRNHFAHRELGHVLDLYILGNGDLNVPKDMDEAQLRNVSGDFVTKIAKALKELLPVANDYFGNRNAILSGKI